MFFYPILHRPGDHGPKPHIGQAEEGKDQRAHEGVQRLEGGEEVGERYAGEPDVGEWRHGPGDAEDEHHHQEAISEAAHLLEDARLADGRGGEVTHHDHHGHEGQARPRQQRDEELPLYIVLPAHPAPGVIPHGRDGHEEVVAEGDHGHSPGQAQVGGALAVNDASSDGPEAAVAL